MVCCALTAFGCDGNKDGGSSALRLSGRAFGSESAKPLPEAPVRLGKVAVASDAEGRFVLTYPASAKDKIVEVRAKEHAPARKAAPEGDGYVEIFAKNIDAARSIEPEKGGEVRTDKGAALVVKAGSLETKAAKAPAQSELVIAVPDPSKALDLGALPGDFTAKQDDQIGKLSAESPIYLDASEKGEALKLKAGEKASITLPARKKNKGAQSTLYRFDEALGLWVEVGPALAGVDSDGFPVYRAEVDRFGWFTVGTFIGELSCIRTCVVREDQAPVPSAHLMVSGVDMYTQSAAFAGADGCLALDVPANARLSLSVQSQGARSVPQLVQSTTGGSASEPDTCLALPPVVVAAAEANICPLGFAQCGDACVDVGRDPAHCGACDQSCGEGRCAGARCIDPDPSSPGNGSDAGVEPVLDASAPADDGGGSACVKLADLEDCLNGMDDDCNARTDCEDPQCEGPASCREDGAHLGFLRPAGTACPDGTTADAQQFHQNPQAGGCGGCSCGTASPTTCDATITAYTNTCTGTPTAPAQVTSYACPSTPIFDGSYYGFSVSFSTASGTCPPVGSPQLDPLSWSDDAVFCRITRKGTGCAAGQACLPRNGADGSAPLCDQTDSGSCSATQTAQTWYTGADDGRKCSACTCNAAGASCAGVSVQLGSDWVCTDSPTLVSHGQTLCGYKYSPPAMLVGTPTSATCTASTSLQGSVLPIGATTFCCAP